MTRQSVTWSDVPSLRPIALSAALAAGVGVVASLFLMPVFLGPLNRFAEQSEAVSTLVMGVNVFFVFVCFGPLLFAGWAGLNAIFTKYEIKNGRLSHQYGILVRKYDQIALHRVRDMKVVVPVGARLFGTGYLCVMSRDESTSVLIMGPFRDPMSVEKIIHQEMVSQQGIPD